MIGSGISGETTNSTSKEQSRAACKGHLVQFYNNDQYLCGSVSEFVRYGLSRGDGVLLLIENAHKDALFEELKKALPNFQEFLNSKKVVLLEANDVLNQILENGHPNFEKFRSAIDSALSKVNSDHPVVRVYSEMVNVLCEKEHTISAFEVEAYWNDYIRSHENITLMCGYEEKNLKTVNGFDEFKNVCNFHSDVIPSEDPNSLKNLESLYRHMGSLELKSVLYKSDAEKAEAADRKLAEMRKAMAVSARLALLGELSDGIVHALNSPLAIIKGTSDRLISEIEGPNKAELMHGDVLKKRLTIISSAVARMTKIVKDVITFSHQDEKVPHVCSVINSIATAVEFMERLCASKGIKIKTNFTDDSLSYFGNEDRMVQVFINIITTAKSAIEQARGKVGGVIEITVKSVSDREMEITFVDNGIGMDSETTRKIFSPYYLGRGVKKSVALGMSVSDGIVRKHQGRIQISSVVGKGTVLRVFLPKHRETHLESA